MKAIIPAIPRIRTSLGRLGWVCSSLRAINSGEAGLTGAVGVSGCSDDDWSSFMSDKEKMPGNYYLMPLTKTASHLLVKANEGKTHRERKLNRPNESLFLL